MEEAIVTKSGRVKEAFERPDRYLSNTAFNIRVRRETVESMVGRVQYKRMLDIGCGNGSISLPLIRSDNHLTLLDISSNMIRIARSRIPSGREPNVEVQNANFMSAKLEPGAYDLIMCMGVLAHVDSPSASIARIAGLLRPGGTLLLEFTDAYHPVGRPRVLYHWMHDIVRPPSYPLNLLSVKLVCNMLRDNHLRLMSTFRYSVWFPRLGALLSQDQLYHLVRRVYGEYPKNRNALFGNQYICLITSDG